MIPTKYRLEAPHTAPRVSIPAATLTFHGCDAHRSHAPYATVRIPDDSPAVINGVRVCGRIELRHGQHFVRWIGPGMDNAERRIGWGVCETQLGRPGSWGASIPDGARKVLTAFAEQYAGRIGTPVVIRAAEAARLEAVAVRAEDEAASLRDQAAAQDAIRADYLTQAAAVLSDEAMPALFAVVMHNDTVSTHGTAAEAIRAATKYGRDRGKRSQYGASSHDFPSVLDVFSGTWLPVPERAKLEAAENAERARQNATA